MIEHAIQFFFDFQEAVGPPFEGGLLEGSDSFSLLEQAGIEGAQIRDFLTKSGKAL
jgi:hypothetical protein